jgi:hypothetical protein
MNTSQTPENKPLDIKRRIVNEFQKAIRLTLYLGTWFCAITFLAETALRERPLHVTIFGLALIKAAICSKFMLIGQAAYPLTVSKKHGIVPSILIESVVYSDPLYIFALSIVYWLIIWPYLLFAGVKLALGDATVMEMLFGPKKLN